MKLIGTNIDMDLPGWLLLIHGILEGTLALTSIILGPPTPWNEVQPPVVVNFLFGGVFAGAVLALSTLFGQRPFPKSSLLTLSIIHYASFVFCVPGIGYPTEGISDDWDSQVSKAGMVIHGVLGTAFAYVYMRKESTKLKGN